MKKNYIFWLCLFTLLFAGASCKDSKTLGKSDTPNVPDVPKPPKVYKIGDIGPGSGIIFYVDKGGFVVYDGRGGEKVCHYLEMSKNTLGGSNWFPEYGRKNTHTGLGYGKSNTYKILHTSTSESLTNENCAAYKCSQYYTESTRAGDWFLPSKDELDLMYKSQKMTVLKDCGDKTWHWSSSEYNHENAWIHNFESGIQADHLKDIFNNSVRAVHSF